MTYDGTNWTPLGIIASGAQGPQGIPGKDGASGTNGKDGKDGKDGTNGTSVYLDDVSTVVGGTQVTLGWGTSDTSAFVIPSGAAGTPGTNGVSPTVALTPIQDQQYPQGGWNVTITDAEHQSGQTFQIFNGIDGQGATVDLVEGNGIQITHQSGTTDYTIGVSANYALKSELPDVSDMATKTWVGQEGFLKSSDLTDYATKTYANNASAYALSQAETWVENKHYLTAVPDSYATKTYANEASANALGQAQSWVETEGYLKAVPAEYATKTYANNASAYALSQAETWVGQQNFATSAGLDANKQYAMTTNGWSDFTIPSTSGYLPLSGGAVSGHLEVHGGSNFDTDFIKLTREGNQCGARIGLGSDSTNGTLALKTFNAQGQNTVQVNVKYNTNNNELVQVQKGGNEVGYLIPAKIHQGSYTPSENDGILHIILES